ncbi:MAG: NADH-quinone oxidoreductase subunit L [Planctomycetota bacterium]
MSLQAAAYIPWIAALGAVLCLVLVARPGIRHYAGPVCVGSIGLGLLLTFLTVGSWGHDDGHQLPQGHDDHHPYAVVGETVTLIPWIYAGGELVDQPLLDPETGQQRVNDQGRPMTQEVYEGGIQIDFGYYFDGLTFTMLLVITGIGMLIAIYAMGYMKGDPGYARFFASMAMFIFAMTTLVMADNLVLLFLGWEGVGLCSYLLIGYYYGKPTAVAAAKKAFIVNRIGDFGFLVGIFLCYQVFGTLSFDAILPALQEHLGQLPREALSPEALRASFALHLAFSQSPSLIWAIPFCLMIGAFGKSAQIPLFVWLPDAMAGPTPVSALVHAATMVTAGVYLIARMMPIFVFTGEYAGLKITPLEVVAIVGGLTALFAATIALTSNDLKGVFAYSTVSQLGYMFLGLGALSTTGAVFHLVTHAFFKALLFLTAGSVMHALAGTLDIRTMGGLGRKMPVTKWLMLAGCLALAGFPILTAGFWSKDLILGDTLAKGLHDHQTLYTVLAVIGVITAFLTAFYTFRLWCIVFTGETKFEMGDEHHAPGSDEHDDAHADDPAADASGHEAHHASGGGPHEMPWWPMNAPLVILAVGSILSGLVLHKFTHLIDDAVAASSAAVPHAHGHGEHAGMDPHVIMMIVSGIIAIAGIGLAYYFYSVRRDLPEKFAQRFAGLTATLRGKYYIDEFYDRTIVQPLNIIGQVLYLIDQLVIHAAVMSLAWLPRMLGMGARPAQSGKLQGYGLGMVAGVAAIALLMLLMLT